MLERFEVEREDQSRYFYAYLPEGDSLPLVLAFHGGGSTPLDMARFCRLVDVAERHRIAVVFPSGSGPWPDYLTWNAGLCCGHAARRNVDDVGFVRRLIDHLLDRFPIDPARVYATGMSNGGMFSYRLAAEMPDRIAAIAPVAGCLTVTPPRLPRVVPVLHFHGTNDHYVPYNGGGGRRSLRQVQFPSVAQSLSQWAEACGLPALEPHYQPESYDQTLANDSPLSAERAVYARNGGLDQVVEIRINGGGHTWPGEAPIWCFLGQTLLGLSASEQMWGFSSSSFARIAAPIKIKVWAFLPAICICTRNTASMIRLFVASVVALCLFSSSLFAQTVRFETSVGDFDMVLNPNDDPNLQPLVDNMIAYVGLGRYHFTAINRAVDNDNNDPSDDFVLQMGGFLGFAPDPDMWSRTLESVERLESVVTDSDGDGSVDFSSITNSRSTVSLALAAGDVNSGTSSFFINLGDNAFLDNQGFVPFAEIQNMSTIDRIMELNQRDLSSQVGQPGSLTFIDVPITEEELIVLVRRAYVVEADEDFSFVGPIATALQLQQRNEAAALAASSDPLSTLSASSSGFDALDTLAVTSTNVPEPGTLLMLVPFALWGLYTSAKRRS